MAERVRWPTRRPGGTTDDDCRVRSPAGLRREVHLLRRDVLGLYAFKSVEGPAARGFGRVDQAAAPQHRGEIPDLAVMIEDLVMEIGEEFRKAGAFLGCDLLQSIPERHFQAD